MVRKLNQRKIRNAFLENQISYCKSETASLTFLTTFKAIIFEIQDEFNVAQRKVLCRRL